MNQSIHLALMTVALASSSPLVVSEEPKSDAGSALAEKLVDAVGGRKAWSGVTFVHVEARHDDLDVKDPFVNRIWNDFSEPRVRFWAGNDQFVSGRRIGGGVGVREVGPQAGTPLTAEQYEADRSWWESNLYRTFHRMAKRDATLTYRALSPSRLEILKPDGSVLSWFVLNQRGEPMLFGSGKDAGGTAFGPLASSGPVRYPKWGARADGSWRYEILRFITAAEPPADGFGPVPN